MLTIKILISGSNFHGTNNTIAKAFCEYGCDVEISNWPDLSGTVFDRSKTLLYEKMNTLTNSSDQEVILNLFKKTIMEYNRKLLLEVSTKQPDVLLVLKGNILLPETLKKIRNNSDAVLVLWCYDSALRFSNVLKGGKYYHIFYTFEPTDIEVLKAYNIHALLLLPMAYDPNSYFKLEDATITRDLSFIGMLNVYPERKKILEMIISRYRRMRLEIWGTAWTWYNPFLQYEYKIKRRALGKRIHNYNIPPQQVNKIYNSTKICLNMHHVQSKEGVNPRIFEILGAGGFQLTDYKKTLENFFEIGREIECYKTEKDLLDKIEYYLQNEDERKKIAQRGNNIVKKKHTYKHRAKTILDDIEKIR